MKTSTIFIAFTDAERELAQARGEAKARGVEYYPIRDKRRIRQAETFQAELLRRMDQRDIWAALRADKDSGAAEGPTTFERIQQRMAAFSDDYKADDVVSGLPFVREYLGLDKGQA